MKKNLLLTLAATSMLLTACGGSAGGGGKSGKVDIFVHCQYGKGPRGLIKTFADEFNALQKDYNVVVDMEMSGDYNTIFANEKMALQDKASDSWGDLVVCYPDHVVDYMLTYRAVAKLDDLMNDPKIGFSEADYEDFTTAASDQFDITFPRTGKFVLPFSTSTECMFYNPVVLTLTLPGVNGGNQITTDYINNLTWDEFFNVFCPALINYNETAEVKILATKDDKGAAQDYGILGYRDDNNFFITLCEQYGYGYTHVDEESHQAYLDFNKKETRDLMKVFNQAKNSHFITSDGAVGGAGIQSWLKENRSLFYVASTGGISYTQAAIEGCDWEIECGRLPQASNEHQKMISQGGSWCILEHDGANKAKRVRGAFEFYRYMTETKQCTRWAAQSGYYPIRKSTTRSNAWAKLIDEYDDEGEPKTGIDLLTARNAKYCETYDRILYTNAVFKGSATARTEVDGLMTKVLAATTATCTDAWLLDLFNETENNIKKVMG